MNLIKKLWKFLILSLWLGTATFSFAEPKIYFVHSDHLNTPQVLTDDNQNVVWKADYQPFGETEVVVHQIDMPLRFPGQYYDKETGYHYNYYRNYDPSLGRYIQSDPIGLAGGLNTYAYVTNNPLIYTDKYGLSADETLTGGAVAAACLINPLACAAGVAVGTCVLYPELCANAASAAADAAKDTVEKLCDEEADCDMEFVRQLYYGGDTKSCLYKTKGQIFTFPQDKELACMPVDKKRCLVDTSFMGTKARAAYGK